MCAVTREKASTERPTYSYERRFKDCVTGGKEVLCETLPAHLKIMDFQSGVEEDLGWRDSVCI